MSPIRTAAPALLLALCVSACAGPSSARPRTSPTPTAASPTAPASGPAASGTPAAATISVGGTPASAGAQVLAGCQRTPGGYGVQLQLSVAEKPSVLSIEILDYHGPDAYAVPPERVSIQLVDSGGASTLEPATSGTVRIDSGERSGSLSVTLRDARATTVEGAWSCG